MAELSIFFKLPLELRNEIYGYLLTGCHDVPTPSPVEGLTAWEYQKLGPGWLTYPRLLMATTWGDWISKKATTDIGSDYKPEETDPDVGPLFKPEYSILRVSRQIYEEASAVLYKYSIFWFYYKVSHLNKRLSPEIKDLEQNLPRVRDLEIIVSEDPCYQGLTSVGVTHMLRGFAKRATSLRWLSVEFWSSDSRMNGNNPVLHELLLGTELPESLCAFTVTNGIQIRVDGVTSSFTYDDYEKWPLFVAETKDWKIYKYLDKERRRGSKGQFRTKFVEWTLKPEMKMCHGEGRSTELEKFATVSRRIVSVTESVHEEPAYDLGVVQFR